MEKILKILEEIKNASGKRKQEILEENKSNELLIEWQVQLRAAWVLLRIKPDPIILCVCTSERKRDLS